MGNLLNQTLKSERKIEHSDEKRAASLRPFPFVSSGISPERSEALADRLFLKLCRPIDPLD